MPKRSSIVTIVNCDRVLTIIKLNSIRTSHIKDFKAMEVEDIEEIEFIESTSMVIAE